MRNLDDPTMSTQLLSLNSSEKFKIAFNQHMVIFTVAMQDNFMVANRVEEALLGTRVMTLQKIDSDESDQ